MKRNFRMPVFVMIALFVAGIFVMQSSYGKIITNVQPDISSKEIRAVVVEDFEQEVGDWKIETEPKQFNADTEAKKKKNPVEFLQMKAVEGAPADLAVEKYSSNGKGLAKTKVLGVNFKFKYPGYNKVSIIPPKPILMPGRSRALSVWVHGRGQDYTLEAIVMDYKGQYHIIKFGSVNFVGWQPLKADIPAFIPQDTDSYPQTRVLYFVKFIMKSTPHASTDNTFFFFDQVKVLSETYEVNFDGEGLEKSFDSAKTDDRLKEANDAKEKSTTKTTK
jgi:hypothetical protein